MSVGWVPRFLPVVLSLFLQVNRSESVTFLCSIAARSIVAVE